MSNIAPETEKPKLIVVMAFDRDEEGELQAVGTPLRKIDIVGKRTRSVRGWQKNLLTLERSGAAITGT